VSHELEISLLGSFLLKWRNETIQAMNSPRLQALLAYLLLNRDKPLSRRQVAFQFWPDTSEAQAFANLRTLLTLLHRALPEAGRFIIAGRRTLQWQTGSPFQLDVADFERALAAGKLEQAVNVYSGDLLPDCYDDWIQPERERLRQDFGRALEKVIQAREEARDYEAAICYAQTYLQHDRLRESTYGHLMRLHALQGSRSQVARIFQECALTLERELGVEPSATTFEMYEQFLRLGQRPPRVCGGHNDLPLVGREREWQYLLARWREAAAGNTGMTLLLGEAGIGKTRFLEECHEWAYRQGITAAYARCYPAQGRLAYAPVTGWLRCPQIRATLGSLERVWLVEIARLLPELSLELADFTRPSPITEGWQRLRLFEALARAVFAAPQPRLLILDDLHWADRETVAWLSFLIRFDAQAELLLLASMRPEGSGAEQTVAPLRQELQRDGLLTTFELDPLDLNDTLRLVASVSGHSCSPEAAKEIFAQSEGNPLFVVEMIRSRAEKAQVETQPTWAGSFQRRIGLTGKMEAVIASRLNELSGQGQGLAALAATCGRHFNLPVLSAAWKSSQEELIAGLDELRRRRLVREHEQEGYDFTHDKIREAVYLRLSRSHRRLLHHSLALALEKVHAAAAEEAGGEIAGHYLKAGLDKLALPHLLHAGEAAVRLYANPEALNHLQCGLAIISASPPDHKEKESETVFRLLDLLGDLLERVGEHEEARAVYELVFRFCPALDAIRQAQTHRKTAQTWLAHYDFNRMMESLNTAERALEPLRLPTPEQTHSPVPPEWYREWLNIMIKKMWIYYWQGEPDRIQELAAGVLPVVNSLGTPRQRADLYNCLAAMVMRQQRYVGSSESLHYARLAQEAAHETGDEGVIAFATFNLGFIHLWAGNAAEAERYLLAGKATADKIGDDFTLVLCLTHLGILHRKTGAVARAREVVDLSLPMATRSQRHLYIGIAQANQAWLCWKEGAYAQAREVAEAALELLERLPVKFPLFWLTHWPLIDIALVEDDIETAIGYAQRLFSPDQQPIPGLLAQILQACFTCWEEERTADARQHFAEAVKTAVSLGYL
jgi:DNA-binding SARP family transcriptional activator/tetratricopeptide (TPR) repeat protein